MKKIMNQIKVIYSIIILIIIFPNYIYSFSNYNISIKKYDKYVFTIGYSYEIERFPMKLNSGIKIIENGEISFLDNNEMTIKNVFIRNYLNSSIVCHSENDKYYFGGVVIGGFVNPILSNLSVDIPSSNSIKSENTEIFGLGGLFGFKIDKGNNFGLNFESGIIKYFEDFNFSGQKYNGKMSYNRTSLGCGLKTYIEPDGEIITNFSLATGVIVTDISECALEFTTPENRIINNIGSNNLYNFYLSISFLIKEKFQFAGYFPFLGNKHENMVFGVTYRFGG